MSNIVKLSVDGTIKEGVNIGIKNIGPILVNFILYILTCWIPYLNLGTTIGLSVGIVSKASKGEPIPMTEIFDPKYRKFMGEFFLTLGLMLMGIMAMWPFLILGLGIPAIVIGLSWSLSLLLVVDKGKNPSEALVISNNCTYGNKWRMVGIYAIVFVLYVVLSIVFSFIPGVGWLLILAATLFYIFVNIGVQASIYKQLTEGV